MERFVCSFVFDLLPHLVKIVLVIMKWTSSCIEFHIVIKISVIVKEIALFILICNT